jgi:hypothetical protein
LSASQGASLIFRESGLPAYSLWEHTLGRGIVGGSMLNAENQGKKAAQYALAILSGTAVESLPVTAADAVAPVFDYDMLRHFDIPQSRLPEAAVIRNAPSPDAKHCRIWIGSTAVLAGSLIIVLVLLARSRHRRGKAERSLGASLQR